MTNTQNLIKTPDKNIPVGMPTRLDSGEPGLQVKRPGENEYDIISLTSLIRQISDMTPPSRSQ
ncbi:MAG: hypothetical protein ACOX7O_11350 [Oscillospiraceae bacterium]